jgi:hypothetical protein
MVQFVKKPTPFKLKAFNMPLFTKSVKSLQTIIYQNSQ